MPAQLIALGLNHQTAPLAVRERVAFAPEQLTVALQALRQQAGVQEAAILSTCNRTELYCLTEAIDPVVHWLANWHGLSREALLPNLYQHPDAAAMRHIFRVACGLDSMVLGEPQILGQLKESVRQAEDAGTLDGALHKLFQKSFAVAKDVRANTGIGESVVSMAAAAVKLAEQVFGRLNESRVLFVGAGEMIALALSHFHTCQPQRLSIANRSPGRAQTLAAQFPQVDTLPLSALGERLSDYDVVVTCTASPLPIIGLGMVERALKQRKQRPMVMVDLAVPRDIEAEVGTLSNIFLYTVDDLAQIVSSGRAARAAAVQDAEQRIETGVAEFQSWQQSRQRVPLIRALREQAENLRQEELDRALRALRRGEAAEAVLEQLSRGLSNKLLHAPTQFINQSDSVAHTALLQALFQLPNTDANASDDTSS